MLISFIVFINVYIYIVSHHDPFSYTIASGCTFAAGHGLPLFQSEWLADA